MTGWNDFRGEAKRIEDLDIPRIGHRIGVGEDELHAFMDVEAAGSGFDRQGRPKMLFEPHVFYRNLAGAERSEAVSRGLAYAKWRSGAYPTDSYPRLVKAMAINETAALRSASWGLGQILGENHAMVGYPTIQEMVRAFMDDEDAHLEAIVSFLIASGIDDDLRAHRWTTVARVYNGPQHAKHNYAGRMSTAYARWSGIRDTAWSPEEPEQIAAPVPTPRPSAPVQEPAMKRDLPVNNSPVEKAIGAAKGAAGGAGGVLTIGGALVFVADAFGYIPATVDSLTLGFAIGTILTGFSSLVTSTIGAYRAPRNAEPA